MPQPICVMCQVEYRPEKNGVIAEEMATGIGSYKLWYADLWKCPVCDHQIIVGFGKNAIAGHWMKEYQDIKAAETLHGQDPAFVFYDRAENIPKEEEEAA